MSKAAGPALVIMAAGIGSRYGGGVKQLEPVGKSGEIIMDFSVYDAIKAGFRKIIFVIRHDIEADFREVIGNRMDAIGEKLGVSFHYAFQEKEDLPEGFTLPEGRTKPWGTCHAVLSCQDMIHEPFAVINADDYYGQEAFAKLYAFLEEDAAQNPDHFCMAGFILKNTLSENGSVTRGVCQMDEEGYLKKITETGGVHPVPGGVDSDNGPLSPDALVSMNMWGLPLSFLQMCREGFVSFLKTVDQNPMKAEFLLPIFIDQLLQEKKVTVKVLPTNDQWFGVTYKEDKPAVVASFDKLYQEGRYTSPLF